MLTTTYPDNEVVTTGYTAQGLPARLTSGLGAYVASTLYDAHGRLDLRVYQTDGVQTDYSCFAWTDGGFSGGGSGGKLQSLKSGLGTGGAGLQNLTYAYDKAGNSLRIRDDVNSGQRQCFTYDALGRLTGAQIGDANCLATTGGNGYYSPET